MLGAAGCLLPELLTKVRVSSAPEHAIRGRGAFLTRLFLPPPRHRLASLTCPPGRRLATMSTSRTP
jgi:hypothetical protein